MSAAATNKVAFATNWGGFLWVAIETDLGLAQHAADIVKNDIFWRHRISIGDIIRMARWVRR